MGQTERIIRQADGRTDGQTDNVGHSDNKCRVSLRCAANGVLSLILLEKIRL